MISKGQFELIVVGAGHAGCEAAWAAARMGHKVALVTINAQKTAYMSCNPAVGGVAKGQLCREVDALGGVMGRVIDQAGIHYKMLNASKGPAVRAPRAQADRKQYSLLMRQMLESEPNLALIEGEVDGIIVQNGRAKGVTLEDGAELLGEAVVLTTGTFLGGMMHIGLEQTPGGRVGDPPSNNLSEFLKSLGLQLGRLKTGTPARLNGKTIDFSALEEQPGDEPSGKFSHFSDRNIPNLRSCYITYTNERTHEIIQHGLSRSPLLSGAITGIGPRYCPSIESKVMQFPDRTRHQVFLEPEGLDTDEVYPNGVSTSLPLDVQIDYLRSIKGLEEVEINEFGYAIEYDFTDPRQLYLTLETKSIGGLYCAGQINGTSGYEEAAAQGLVAGINAMLAVDGREPFVLGRNEAYIGVLIDDLVTKGVSEPYRMFTSLAEYRLLLRQDNADFRLAERGAKLGLVPKDYAQQVDEWKRQTESEVRLLQETIIKPSEEFSQKLESMGQPPLRQPTTLASLLSRPGMKIEQLREFGYHPGGIAERAREQVEIEVKYAGYIKRQLADIEKMKKMETRLIPGQFDFRSLAGLSSESKEKLESVRPRTLGQASRITGVSPSDIATLYVALEKGPGKKTQ